MSAEGGKFTVV
jgi:hypothetical protein